MDFKKNLTGALDQGLKKVKSTRSNRDEFNDKWAGARSEVNQAFYSAQEAIVAHGVGVSASASSPKESEVLQLLHDGTFSLRFSPDFCKRVIVCEAEASGEVRTAGLQKHFPTKTFSTDKVAAETTHRAVEQFVEAVFDFLAAEVESGNLQ